MSHTQLIKDTLNILDLNIYFEENCLTKEKIQRANLLDLQRNSSVQARRVFPLSLCRPPLGSFVGGTTTVRLLLNDVSEYRTYLELKKQRFKCKSCQRTFVADTSVAEKTLFH